MSYIEGVNANKKFNQLLIQLVKENKVSWKLGKPQREYNRDWQKISKGCNKSVEFCKKRWKLLRDKFLQASKISNTNYTYYKELSFLKSFESYSNAISDKSDYNRSLNKELIKLVKEQKCIWESDHNEQEQHNAWKDISTTLNKSVKLCKGRWKTLRNRFCIEIKKPTTNFEFFDDLSFLRDVVHLWSDDENESVPVAGSTKILHKTGHEKNNESTDDSGDGDWFEKYFDDEKEDDNFQEIETIDEDDVDMSLEYLDSETIDENMTTIYHLEEETNIIYQEQLEKIKQENESFRDDIYKQKTTNIKYGHIFLFKNTFYYNCYYCHEQFTSGVSFEEHCLGAHPEGVNELEAEFSEDENEDNESYMKNEVKYYKDFTDLVDIKPLTSFQCNICDYKTISNKDFKNHGYDKHPGEFVYKCDLCDHEFTKYKYMAEHRNIHRIKSGQNCVCGKHFIFISRIRKHMKICEIWKKNQSKLQHSQDSSRILDNDTNFNTDIDMNDSRFDCAICDFHTNSNKKFIIHFNKYHQQAPKYECEICSQIFQPYASLIEHKKKYHTDEYSSSCEDYSKILIDRETIEIPPQEHFQCGLCEFESIEKEPYIDHCNVDHPTEAAYKCDICSSLFMKFRHLNEHREVHRLRDGPICQYCGIEILSNLRNFRYHEYTHENESDNPELGKIHRKLLKCGCCTFESHVIREYIQHCSKHISKGETPYKCWICNEIFGKYNSLMTHLSLHPCKFADIINDCPYC